MMRDPTTMSPSTRRVDRISSRPDVLDRAGDDDVAAGDIPLDLPVLVDREIALRAEVAGHFPIEADVRG